MNIGDAAAQSELAPKTIRYYESVGLIQSPARTAGGYRDYGEADVQTLRFVARARGLGFSVAQVAELLSLYNDRDRTSADVKAITMAHIDDIDRKMAELESMKNTLSHLVHMCHGDDRPDCPILDDLAKPADH
ncbi:MAG: Cu(I)-responsive transcriptional regulator [Alphaproteobacteria bacterium]|jgi:MerR family transcriptional regulator, copper efflux regulator|nr:Cu(I)-responsive transcriptional regulator [Alphaproteobacteria bacterium]MBT5859736.1 Cu(I)-responsive transcriptional regulator [Alphaproteobacteria bacterium]